MVSFFHIVPDLPKQGLSFICPLRFSFDSPLYSISRERKKRGVVAMWHCMIYSVELCSGCAYPVSNQCCSPPPHSSDRGSHLRLLHLQRGNTIFISHVNRRNNGILKLQQHTSLQNQLYMSVNYTELNT
jgi:hypothetical protein